MKRKNRLIVPLTCWAWLAVITLSCNMPAERDYMVIESITPVSTGINQPITVTVSVLGKAYPGTGTMTVDGDTRCSFLLVEGRGSCQVVFYSAGDHTITINYSGDSSYHGEYVQRPYTVVASLTPTPNTLTNLSFTSIGPEPSSPGESVEFGVLVSPTAGPAPIGMVTLNSDSQEGGCTANLSNGEGRCTMTFARPGIWRITATYPTNGTWVGSTASILHTVSYATEITITLNNTSPRVGQTVHVTATVSVPNGGPAPTGVLLIDYSTEVLEADLVDGSTSFDLVFHTDGEQTIHALYHPADSTGQSINDFRASETSLTVTVRIVAAPPPEPTQEPSGGGATGCEVYDPNSDTWICVIPCPDPDQYFHTCP
ncbi:MAG: Ig-like domain repeat protein [Anaerolineales bacterium]|nr:Ig-like domain repeat protein [Anaerolineales bacterium]